MELSIQVSDLCIEIVQSSQHMRQELSDCTVFICQRRYTGRKHIRQFISYRTFSIGAGQKVIDGK